MPSFETTSDGLAALRHGRTILAIGEIDGRFRILRATTDKAIESCVADDFHLDGGFFHERAEAEDEATDLIGHIREREGLDRVNVDAGRRTPWGVADDAVQYGEGVISYGTPSHGGIKLDRKRNAMVHPAYRNEGGWYEEDSEWAKVAATFPQYFTTREVRKAERTLRDWNPDAYETVTGITLAPGESREKDRKAFESAHAKDFIVISAIGNDDGMVECVATLGGQRSTWERDVDERRFLVTSEEYAKRGPFGFVINTSRHEVMVSGPTTAP